MSHGEFGLAERQRDALITALEPGYFVVPREATTAELADELDVSPRAISQRLRRGIRNLRASTIGTQEPEKDSGLSLSPRWQDAS
jgi:predicted DNA binding protein